MTAPSLLDELEGVVRLAEKATPGPWRWSENGNILGHMPNGYDSEREVGAIYTERDDDQAPANAEAIIAAMHFIRAHHAEIADMAKRLEAAERDAETLRRALELLPTKIETETLSDYDSEKIAAFDSDYNMALDLAHNLLRRQPGAIAATDAATQESTT